MKRIVMASAILLALTGAPALAELQVFPLPEYAGHRIDLCRVWGSECGQPAADEFCRRQGYTSAEGFTIDHDIGSATATRTLVDGGICNQQFCDGFESITCTRPGPGPLSSPTSPGQPRPGRLKLPGMRESPPSQPPQQELPPPPPPPAEPPAPAAPVYSEPPWTPKDVIRSNIDVQAQYALLRLLKGDARQRSEASHILSAIRAGALQGIYQEDQQAPALRAQALGQWWGQILPKGVDGVCMTQPAAKAPLIAMRRGTPADRASYDQSLLSAWQQCDIKHDYPLRRYDPTAGGGSSEPAGANADALQCRNDGDRAALHARCDSAFQSNLTSCDKVKAGALQVVQGVVIQTYDKCITRISSIREECHWITDNEICRN